MRHLTPRLATTALITLAGLIAPVAPLAVAEPADVAGPSVLVMSVTPGTPEAPGVSRATVLECGAQPGGTHPAPATACATLRTDGLDFTTEPALQVMCPDIVRPVTVTATGLWDGVAVNYQHTYPNQCLLRRATGVLFTF